MPLPDLVEIVPFEKPVSAEITVPGSKSITNRALILAALAQGETVLTGALWSEDTQVMVECLRELGFMVNVEPDPKEPCNRTITAYGKGGEVPRGGTEMQPSELFVGNAGTAARFLAAFVCLGSGAYHLGGTARMHERPQSGLFGALRDLGYRVEPDNGDDRLPARILVEPRRAANSGESSRRSCKVDINQSSQFASALLMCARPGNWSIEVVGENAEESPYVAMTNDLMKKFPVGGGSFAIEPDASSASYFWAANSIASKGSRISVSSLPQTNREGGDSHLQIDAQFQHFIQVRPWRDEISRTTDLGDSIMTAIVIAPLAGKAMRFVGLGKLRLQECERVAALRTELTKCGAMVNEDGDTLNVHPSRLEELNGAEIDTYNDHRMAMCFAVLGLKVPGMKIKNPACVKKTFPNFFQKLAAQPPHGLGVEIWEIAGGRRVQRLAGADLFAG